MSVRPDRNTLAKAGIVTDRSLCLENQKLNLISILVPFTGAALAVASIPVLGVTSTTLFVFTIFSIANSAGIELGLHRYFTHRAFRTGKIFRTILGVLGTWAFQGPIIRWVADHRRHHRFTDKMYDPHSPYWNNDGPVNHRLKGLLWAHFFWMLRGHVSDPQRYAADLMNDSISARLSQYYWWVATGGIIAPALVGYAINGPDEFMRCLLWAGCFRVFLLHQLTWSINSICHSYGTQVNDSRDQSRDNKVISLLTLGAGLHSYHHKHPSAAINQPARWDITGMLVTILEKAGVIWNIRKNSRVQHIFVSSE